MSGDETAALIAELNDEIGELCDEAKADGLPEPWPVHLLGRCRDELERLQRAENTVKAEALSEFAEYFDATSFLNLTRQDVLVSVRHRAAALLAPTTENGETT